jgi:SagB-type dehydrogenase family enzyme
MLKNKWAFMFSINLNYTRLLITFLFISLFTGACNMSTSKNFKTKNLSFSENIITLSKPILDSKISIEKALNTRRSIRNYKKSPLSLEQISQLLWAAQGITNSQGLRTAPSAGALYPLEIYLVSNNVSNLDPGVYSYKNNSHTLKKISQENKISDLSGACLNQECVKNCSAAIVICVIYERTTQKYGPRGKDYALIEVGCASQNIHLQAVSLNIGTVYVGGFEEHKVTQVIQAKNNEHPWCVMPLGTL